jgi:hypothetical protein
MTKRSSNTIRTLVIVVLVALIGYGLVFLPEGRTGFPEDSKDAEEALHERFDSYVVARKEYDFDGLYEMADPVQREIVDKPRFMSFYGNKMQRTRAIDWLACKINPEARTALLNVRTETELVPEEMPQPYRQSFQMPDDPSELIQSTEHDFSWIWREGEWYYRLEPEVMGVREDVTPLGQSR